MAEQAPAGWYPEGDDGGWSRYWDGTAWTEHRQAATVTVPPAPVAAPPPSGRASLAPLPGPLPTMSAARPVSTTERLEPPAGHGFVPGGFDVRPLAADPWFVHLLRYFLVGFAMGLSMIVVVGYIWLAVALAKTGRRKRDLLMLLVPVWGNVVMIQTLWRYTAKDVYWSVRADRPSDSLFAR